LCMMELGRGDRAYRRPGLFVLGLGVRVVEVKPPHFLLLERSAVQGRATVRKASSTPSRCELTELVFRGTRR
jgi:hypothetical protein